MGYLARAVPAHGGVHNVSSAPASPREDHRRRLRGYLITMGIRTVAFAAAGVALIGFQSTPAAMIAAVLAVILPYPAVVLANAADRHQAQSLTPADDLHHLGSSSSGQRDDPLQPPIADIGRRG